MTPRTAWASWHPYSRQWSNSPTVQSRREDLILIVEMFPGSTTAEIAKALAISTSLAGRLLRTLERHGNVRRRKLRHPHVTLNFKTITLHWYPSLKKKPVQNAAV